MGAKDTLLDISYASRDDIVRDIEQMRLAQVEHTWSIAFKAGKQEGYDKGTKEGTRAALAVACASPEDALRELLEEWKKAGIKELAELIDTKRDLCHTGYHGYAGETPNPTCMGCQIEAFLKERLEK